MSDEELSGVEPDRSRMPGQGLTKEEAFLRVLDGHWRYLENRRRQLAVTEADRSLHSQGQYPFAAILGCADSRVSPEVIFDQGQGDLFVVRVAGHVVGDFEVASLEYAIENLGVKLIIVMGHEQCGAVKAALAGAEVAGPIGRLLEEIRPAVGDARGQSGDLLGNAIRSHVVKSVEALLARSQAIQGGVDDGRLRLIGLIYDLASGDLDIRTKVG